jgi:hypothetical protein
MTITPPKIGIGKHDEDDDLFTTLTTAPLADLQHRIVCAVCQMGATIFIGAPGDLCNACRHDPLLTRQHVEETIELARSRLHVLIAECEGVLARESQADQARWRKVVEARIKGPTETFRARWQATLKLGDGLSRILRAHEVMEAGCDEVSAVEMWGAKALAELAMVEGASQC